DTRADTLDHKSLNRSCYQCIYWYPFVPRRTALVKSVPAVLAPVRSASVRSAPVKSAPLRSAPEKLARESFANAKFTRPRAAPWKFASVKFVCENSVRIRPMDWFLTSADARI